VRVHVGPIASGSALLWIDYARGVLADRATGPDAPPSDVITAFVGYLDMWQEVADASSTFLWEADVDAEQVQFLALALFRVASQVYDTVSVGRFPVMPDESIPFYRAMVEAFLDAMVEEGGSLGAYAEELRSTWPRLADGER
jgi:hypothetical protein